MAIDLTKLFGSEDSDKKMRNTLLKALKENHIETFDYLKFRQAVLQLQQMDLDAATSFKSAFATASTMGLTKAKLKKTGDHYLNVLNKEKRIFAEALGNQITNKVEAKKIKATEYNSKISACESKILELQKEIEAYKTKMANIDTEIEKDQHRISETRDNFNQAFSNIFETIEEDMGLIDQYL